MRNQSIRKVRASLTAFLLAAAAACASSQQAPPPFVAHAGGVASQRVYTNSLEAMEASAEAGHTLLELDFNWTTDDQLVLIHDWDINVRELLDVEPGLMSLEAFRAAESRWGLTHLTADDLLPFLERHPDVDIMTDVKGRNLEGLAWIAERYPDDLHRFVPQIYALAELEPARALGFERLLLTLYVSRLTDEDVLAAVEEHDLWAIAMPLQRAKTELPARLAERGVFVYAHTVNDYLTLAALREAGVSGVYTDWLSPRDERRPPREGPLPDWELVTSGHTELVGPAAAFLPPAGVGFTTRFDIANEAEYPVWLRFEVVNALGLSTETHERVIAASNSEAFDLGEVAARAQGWIRYTVPAELRVEPRWIYRGRDIEWAFVNSAHAQMLTSGTGAGLGGHMLALVNPSDETQLYHIERTIGGELVHDEIVELEPSQQVVRVFGCRTDEIIEVRATGGPMVTQTLRWDRHLSTMR